MIDLQKKSFIEPAESCPHWLRVTLWRELGRLVQKDMIANLKNIFLDMLSNTYLDFISDMEVTDHRHYDR